MKRTTLALDDVLIELIKERARQQARTFQDCANELLRLGLDVADRGADPPRPMPVFSLGTASVDIADRDALYQLMEDE